MKYYAQKPFQFREDKQRENYDMTLKKYFLASSFAILLGSGLIGGCNYLKDDASRELVKKNIERTVNNFGNAVKNIF